MMLRWGVILIVAVALGGGASARERRSRDGGDGIPNLDYVSTCRSTPAVAMDQKQTLNSCLNDEKQAKADLPAQWRRSKGEWRSSCLRQTTLGGLASYVELITCLEMHDPNPPSLNRPGMTQPPVGTTAGTPSGAPPGPGPASKSPSPPPSR